MAPFSSRRWIRKWVLHSSRAHAASPHGPSFSRRAFLRRGASLAGAAGLSYLSSCFSVQKSPPGTSPEARAIESLAQEGGVVTELRKGQSVKRVLEGWDEALVTEMGFHKSRAGRLIPAGYDRMPTSVRLREPGKGIHSELHTHIVNYETAHPLRVLFASNPSPKDILRWISFHTASTTFPRFTHVACMSPRYGVMGYYSLRLSNRVHRYLDEMENVDRMSENAKDFLKTTARLRALEKDWSARHTESEYEAGVAELRACLARLKDLGLQIRITAMPGFEYREGFFQKRE